jgi:hypothetical protein
VNHSIYKIVTHNTVIKETEEGVEAVCKVMEDMRNEAKLKWNDNDNNNINYFTKLLSLNKCLNLIKSENKASIINNNDYEEDNIDNNMIID